MPDWTGDHIGLAGHNLQDVVKDVRSRAYCGLTAVASIVDHPLSVVRDAFRYVRVGWRWPEMQRAPIIRGTSTGEIERVLEVFGYSGHWQTVRGNPTLASFLDDREGKMRTHPCIVEVTGHCVAVSGWQFCDTSSRGVVVDAEEAPGRRKRVKRVFVATFRGPPLSTFPKKVRSR